MHHHHLAPNRFLYRGHHSSAIQSVFSHSLQSTAPRLSVFYQSADFPLSSVQVHSLGGSSKCQPFLTPHDVHLKMECAHLEKSLSVPTCQHRKNPVWIPTLFRGFEGTKLSLLEKMTILMTEEYKIWLARQKNWTWWCSPVIPALGRLK